MKTKVVVLLILISTLFYAQTKPYLILVSFDGFRWDYLNRGLTPNLKQIGNAGVSSLSLRPTFPTKTFPNHLSIITGMYPSNHGIIANNFEDKFTKTSYRMGDTNSIRDSKWYQGEAFWETAERQGIKTASYFWPGSELKLAHRHPTYYKNYEHNKPYIERIEGVINWLQLPHNERPHFITLYMHETDNSGHKFGPNSSETDKAIGLLDSLAGTLTKRLVDINMKDSVNVIFVSDHGMTEVSADRTINIEKIIAGLDCRITDEGVLMTLETTKNNLEEVYSVLKQNENHFRTYYRKDVPEYFHFSENPLIGEIVLIPEMGWSLVTERGMKWLNYSKGNHGFDNNHTDMHGIFLASGPSFKQGYKAGTLWNIDIYPLLCKIFNIMPRTNIDGKFERIGFILK